MNNDLVIITLDKERELRLGNKAVKKLEKMFKKNITQITQEFNTYDLEQLEKILFECLQYENGEVPLTMEQFSNLLDEYVKYGDIIIHIMELLAATFGTEEEIAAKVEKITGKKQPKNE